MKIVAFVPIRLNSKRVIGKNLKKLGNQPLMCYLIKTLDKISKIDEIYVYCSSEEVKPYLSGHVKFLKRNAELDQDGTLGREIYDAFVNTIDADLYILAHTTSPFIKASTIENAIEQIEANHYDSAFSVEKIQTFTWFDGKPLNYSLDYIPLTQNLKPIFVETSAFFMFKKEIWLEKRQRIGDNPYLAVTDKIESVDVDNDKDFEFAEKIVAISEK